MISEKRQRFKYVIADFVATNLAMLTFNAVRYHLLSATNKGFVSLTDYLLSPAVLSGQILFPVVMLGIYWLSGYYNNVFVKSRTDEILTTLATSFAGALLIFFVVLVNDMSDDRALDYTLFVMLSGLLFLWVYIPRWMITSNTSRLVRNGLWGFDTLVVGAGDEAADFGHRESVIRSMGMRVRGYVRVDGEPVSASLVNDTVIEFDRLREAVGTMNIARLVMMQRPEGSSATLGLINRLFTIEKPVYVSPDSQQLIMSPSRTRNVAGDPLIDITRSDMPQSVLNIKRVSDVVVSMVTLILISPLLLCVAAAVKLDSPGPAFYRQRRIGYHKRPFDIIKFRTMCTDAEADGCPALSMGDGDQRITRVGRFLRKYRIDELPQFWNVVRGEMSIVGPRPEREYFIKRIIEQAPHYVLLHQIRPGITSWGMVRYGYAVSVEQMVERLRYDMLYLENVSFSVDMKIILHTINTVLKGKGK